MNAKYLIISLVVLNACTQKIGTKLDNNINNYLQVVKSVIDYRFSRKSIYYGQNPLLKVYHISTINNQYDAYCWLHLAYQYQKTNGKEGENNVLYKRAYTIDFEYFIRHLKDTIQINQFDEVGDLPVKFTNETSIEGCLIFSPLIPTSKPHIFILPVGKYQERDSPYYFFEVYINGNDIKVQDITYWCDFLYCYIEEEDDLFLKKYKEKWAKRK